MSNVLIFPVTTKVTFSSRQRIKEGRGEWEKTFSNGPGIGPSTSSSMCTVDVDVGKPDHRHTGCDSVDPTESVPIQ